MNLVINIDDIPEDEEYLFDQVERPDYFKVDPAEGILKKDVRVRGVFSKTGDEALFRGNLSTEMELTCSRCLEPFRFKIQAQVDSHYLPGQEAGEIEEDKELHSSDFETEYYTGDRIDLTQTVYDQMMLSLPLVPLCKEDCKGICFQCGVNRNKQDCRCSEKDSIDPRLAVLKSLKDKLK